MVLNVFLFSLELLLVQVLKHLMMIQRTERREEEEQDIQPGGMEVMVMVRILQDREAVEVTVEEMEVRIDLEDLMEEEGEGVEEVLELEEVVKIKDQDPADLEEDIIGCIEIVDIE